MDFITTALRPYGTVRAGARARATRAATGPIRQMAGRAHDNARTGDGTAKSAGGRTSARKLWAARKRGGRTRAACDRWKRLCGASCRRALTHRSRASARPALSPEPTGFFPCRCSSGDVRAAQLSCSAALNPSQRFVILPIATAVGRWCDAHGDCVAHECSRRRTLRRDRNGPGTIIHFRFESARFAVDGRAPRMVRRMFIRRASSDRALRARPREA
jgi:hypothetical protein